MTITEDFRLTIALEASRGWVRTKGYGPIDSAAYVDNSIAFFKTLEDPWRYHSLVDWSQCTGFVVYEDLFRLAASWAPYLHRMTAPRKIAVVSVNRLTVARMPSVDQLFPGQIYRPFATVVDAESWLAG